MLWRNVLLYGPPGTGMTDELKFPLKLSNHAQERRNLLELCRARLEANFILWERVI